jgi:hypothetical protein
MRRRRVWLAVAVLTAAIALGIADLKQAQSAPSRCRLSDLDGLYIFAATGWGVAPGTTPVPDPLPPKAIIEWIRFNGDGTLDSAGATRSLNGSVAQVPAGSSGTYIVTDLNPSDGGCAGSIQFTNGPMFDVFFAPSAAVISLIQADQHNVFQGTATKISH